MRGIEEGIVESLGQWSLSVERMQKGNGRILHVGAMTGSRGFFCRQSYAFLATKDIYLALFFAMTALFGP
jgi:hypothetical protein